MKLPHNELANLWTLILSLTILINVKNLIVIVILSNKSRLNSLLDGAGLTFE